MGEETDEAPWRLDKFDDFRICSLLQLSEQAMAPSVDQAAAASVQKVEKSTVSQHFLSSHVHYMQICSNQVSQLSRDALPPSPRLLCTIPAGGIPVGCVLPIFSVDVAKTYCTFGTSNVLDDLKFSENPFLSQSTHPSINGVSSAKNQSSKEGNSGGGRDNTVVTQSRGGTKREARNKAAFNTRLRGARITEGIKALEICVPCSVQVLSQSRLNGEAAKYPSVYVEFSGEPLEEMMKQGFNLHPE